MFRIDSPGNLNNKFTQGNPLANPPVPPTVISDLWVNAMQEEIAHFIEASGGTLNKADSGQLWEQFRNYIASNVAINFVANITSGTIAGSVTVSGFYTVGQNISDSPFGPGSGWLEVTVIDAQDTLIIAYGINSPGVWQKQKIAGVWQTAWQDVNGVSTPGAGALMRRDTNGRAQVNDPVTNLDIVNLEYLNNNAASIPTAGALVRRDANGRAQVADPSAAADIATKNYVDSHVICNTFTLGSAGTAWNITGLNITQSQKVQITLQFTLNSMNGATIGFNNDSGSHYIQRIRYFTGTTLTNIMPTALSYIGFDGGGSSPYNWSISMNLWYDAAFGWRFEVSSPILNGSSINLDEITGFWNQTGISSITSINISASGGTFSAGAKAHIVQFG